MISKKKENKKRHKKIRFKVIGNKNRPRLCVFRSAKHIYAQIIDDENKKVLVSTSDIKTKIKGNKSEKAFQVGKLIAKEALAKKINKIVFDRGGRLFHGRVKALADGAREGGLDF